jgi:CTP synthase
MTKYIFVTGGVISSLGKGLLSACLGSVLESRGLKISFIKMDPYLNVDPGTMSPYEHGEVYVTNDGAETDLDLGHYERFTSVKLSKNNNFTSGQVYFQVLEKERKGEFLGKTVQVVPHITDTIKELIYKNSKDIDICIVEVGGTIGDIESLPFLEAIRQIKFEREGTVSIHLAYVPFIKVAGEVKTKPVQHSVKDLRAIGIQPDVIACRSEKELDIEIKKKIALYTNVPLKGVISLADAKSIYEIPIVLKNQKLDEIIVDKLNLNVKESSTAVWENLLLKQNNPKTKCNIAIIGKYMSYADSYKSVIEALNHASIKNECDTKYTYIEAEQVDEKMLSTMNIDGLLIPGGFGSRGIEEKIKAIKYVRENNIPYLGICLGMQLAVIEYARANGHNDASSTEFTQKSSFPIIALVKEWEDETSKQLLKANTQKLGGTLRLGGQDCVLDKNSNAFKAYGYELINERHRHRYEVNNSIMGDLLGKDLLVSGRSKQGLIEMIEIKNHPWFVACQFHPEFNSNPRDGHPLFNSFIKAAIVHGNK